MKDNQYVEDESYTTPIARSVLPTCFEDVCTEWFDAALQFEFDGLSLMPLETVEVHFPTFCIRHIASEASLIRSQWFACRLALL